MKVELGKVELNQFEFDIFINDIKVGYDYRYNDDSRIDIHVDEHLKEEILKYKINEFDSLIDSLLIRFNTDGNKNFEWIEGSRYVQIRLKDFFDEKTPNVKIEVQADIENWEKPFSLIKMVEKLEQLCKKDTRAEFQLEDPLFINNGFGIAFQITDNNVSLKTLYQEILEKFDELISASISSLLFEAKQNSMTSIFRFPDEIQVPCEQYLVYFSKFLEDLGINAKTSIETEAQNTLFTVTPEDPTQALSQIRDALNIYLSFPEIPEVEIISTDYSDIAIQQLISNVLHLKSQLVLANSTIQVKEATIQSLSLTNFQQRQLLKSADDKKPSEEKVLDGLITINEYEGKGFKLNLAEIFRRLKRRFK